MRKYMNYFEIFGIEEKFEIDIEMLHARYIELQKKYHPDIVKDDKEKLSNAQFVANLNSGYGILKDDYLRAAYYLKLRNIDILKEEQLEIKISHEMLCDILNKREKLEEIKSEEIFLKFKAQEMAKRQENLLLMVKFFDNNEIEKAALYTILLKYQDNLIHAINQKIEECLSI